MTCISIERRIQLKTILVCLAVFLALKGYSQTETFDIVSFTPPQTWKRDLQDGSVSYSVSKGKISCLIGLYASRPVKAVTETEFLSEWNEFVNLPYGLDVKPEVKRSQFNEWTVFSGFTEITTKLNGTYILQLISFVANDKIISALINCNGTLYDKETNAFLSSIKLLEKINSSVVNNNLPVDDGIAKVKTSEAEADQANKGITGVWVGFETGNYIFGLTSRDYINNHNNYGSTYSAEELALKWRVFFDEGTYYEGMPKGGLINFNKKDKANSYVGSYNMENNIATAKLDHYMSAIRTFVFYPPDKLKYLNKYGFVKCRPVDGLTLNGTYTCVELASLAYYISLNKPNPTISFTNDGHFTDNNFIGEYSRDPQSGPGSGTYEIRNFTIIFKYTDGRIIHKSFTAFLDEDPSDCKVFFIGSRALKLAL